MFRVFDQRIYIPKGKAMGKERNGKVAWYAFYKINMYSKHALLAIDRW